MKKGFGERLRELFGIGLGEAELFEELEDLLIESDMGAVNAVGIVDELRELSKKDRLKDRAELTDGLKRTLSKYVKAMELTPEPGKLNFYLVLGVNGVGKTTTIAKLARHYSRSFDRKNILLVAGDTFRAAAVDQLKLHGERLGFRVVAQGQGADPGAVMFDGIDAARAHGAEIVLADTAGRMHNKANLVKELQKIDKVIRGRLGDGNYRKLLIIDSTTGQNGLRQVEIFHEAVGIDAIILAKYDSTAKGGIAVAVSRDFGIPVSFVGTGEKPEDLMPFSVSRYLDELLSQE